MIVSFSRTYPAGEDTDAFVVEMDQVPSVGAYLAYPDGEIYKVDVVHWFPWNNGTVDVFVMISKPGVK